MESIILVVSVGVINILCFFIGAKVGQKVVKDEPIELPTINPLEIYKEKQEKNETEKEIKEIEIMLQNIDNYGTNKQQQEIK